MRDTRKTIGAMMVDFVIEQQWITRDGKRHGQVVEISDEGTSGVVEVTDDKGGRDTFRGTATAFQLLAPWQIVI
jgi:hypothetical protein